MTLADPNPDDFIAAQLSAVTLVQRLLTGKPTNIPELFEDLPADVGIVTLAMMCRNLLAQYDEEERTVYLAAAREDFIDGKFLPDHLKGEKNQ